jgi:hypothetical protein
MITTIGMESDEIAGFACEIIRRRADVDYQTP